MQIVEYHGYKVEVIPAEGGGYYCKWDSGETYTAATPEIALFLAGKSISDAELYGAKEELNRAL